MTLVDKHTSLLNEFGDYLESADARSAFDTLIGASAALQEFSCYPQHKGVVQDFRFYTPDGEQPFAFIINKNSLLFYLRKPAVTSRKYSLQKLDQVFQEVKDTGREEWTIKLRTRDEAIAVISELLSRW